MDKTFWQDVIAADYTVPEGHTAASLTPELLGYLGSSDPELRDEIGYGVFVRWLIAGHYTSDDLRGYMQHVLPNLTVGLGEPESDSVFLRAFSVLVLAAGTYFDNHHTAFLTEAEIRELDTRTAAYFLGERDLRGFVPGKGWAHSCAHTADLIDELVQHRMLGAEDVAAWLARIADKVLAPTGTVFRHDEDERLAVAVVSALKRDVITADHVAAWLQRFTAWNETHPRYSYVEDAGLWSAYLNAKNLLRAVTIRLQGAEDLPDSVRGYAPAVLDTLKAYSLRM